MNKITKAKIKLLTIEKQLISKYISRDLTKEDIQRLYIEYLQVFVKLNRTTPVYERGYSKYDGCNCYMYALGITEKKLFTNAYRNIASQDFFYNAGFTTFRSPTHEKPEFLKYIEEDFQALGIQAYDSSVDSPLQNGGHKISLFFSDTDFHLARQNKDGTWTEKIGYKNMIRSLKNPYISNMGTHYQYDRTIEIVKPKI